ncbi:MAG TPA: ABC transporter permease, partial [Mycobacterium sp.]|nr:ABC transporter permease [Mycobacterium sp.]
MTAPTQLAAAPKTPGRRCDRKWTAIRWASPLALLALWQLGSAFGVIPQDVLPAPSLIVEAGIELIGNGQLADALQVSGVR